MAELRWDERPVPAAEIEEIAVDLALDVEVEYVRVLELLVAEEFKDAVTCHQQPREESHTFGDDDILVRVGGPRAVGVYQAQRDALALRILVCASQPGLLIVCDGLEVRVGSGVARPVVAQVGIVLAGDRLVL